MKGSVVVMAEFTLVEGNKYRISGTLSEDDISRINRFKNRTTLILENTVGLSSELISKINSDRIVFSIKGGLDYDKKKKFKSQHYVDRTFVSPSGLRNILKYFEYSESMMDPNWNEFEKAMFLYNALVVDMEYAADYENIQSRGVTERSLNGILYGKLVCAGFAQVYKEMLDRSGIKNYYQNQKDVHAFNVLEIDGKKYGVDVTWDNCDKKNNNGMCGFGRFAHDPEFYSRHGHQLYKEIDVSPDFESPAITERIYDTEEEEYDLSLLNMDQLNEYYSHIASRIESRRPFRYKLQDQSYEIKIKYLPVDTVDYYLKKEANQEYSILTILGFLNKRNSLQLNKQLLEAYRSRRGYIMDVSSGKLDYNLGRLDLASIGLNNYEISIDGNLEFDDGDEKRCDRMYGVTGAIPKTSSDEMNSVCNFLNQYLNDYFKKYIMDMIGDIDNVLSNYEFKPEEFDTNRFLESANINSKISIIAKSPDYLAQLGLSEDEINNVISKINARYNELHKPYEKVVDQKENDLDFLSAVFDDYELIWNTMEYDLQKQITKEEFVSLFSNVEYMIKLFEQYITIAGEKKFDMNDYSISNDDLQELLNRLIQEYQNKYMVSEMMKELDDQDKLEVTDEELEEQQPGSGIGNRL